MKNGNRFIKYEKGQLIGPSIYLYDVECPPTRKEKIRFARFICQCGNEYEASIEKVKCRGDRCAECAKKNLVAIGKANFKHGFTGKIKLYGTWQGIKNRCYKPENKFYYCYGAKGIGMFEEWIHDFKAFYDYITDNLGEKPTSRHSLDRIKNELGYMPGNIKWSNPK